MIAVDLFAGPGGWDLGGRALGIEPLGIEWDDAACRTREAAGLRTLQADVAQLRPEEYGPVDLLVASPPCQAFSMAGSGHGRRAMSVYEEAIERWMEGKPPSRAELDEACEDERAHLVLEPLRWALALRPSWIACEQVEPVLPLWESMARGLRATGYRTWTGVLSAERFGVPQTRKRAILLASLAGPVVAPAASHARYVPPRRVEEATLGLFDAGEPERIVLPEDRGLLPWVSMAEALGWGMTQRPFFTATSGDGQRIRSSMAGSSAVRDAIYDEREAGRWAFRATNARPNAAERVLAPPAPSLAFGHERPVWVVDTGNTRSGSRKEGRARMTDEPAPVVTSRADQLEWRDDEPDTRPWPADRPATAVQGDPRIFHPGGHIAHDGRDNSKMMGRSEGTIRVSIDEAAVLQTFPVGYPWQGTKTAMFTQIGNAVPPLLARAVLASLVGDPPAR